MFDDLARRSLLTQLKLGFLLLAGSVYGVIWGIHRVFDCDWDIAVFAGTGSIFVGCMGGLVLIDRARKRERARLNAQLEPGPRVEER